MKRQVNKKMVMIIVSVAVVLCLGVFVLLTCVPFKVAVNEELTGVAYNLEDINDNSDSKVIYNGYYYDYILELWKDDYYKGDITIIGEESHSFQLATAGFVRHKRMDGKTMYYTSIMAYAEEDNVMATVGDIYKTDGDITSGVAIYPKNSEYGYVFPAENMEDAQKLVEDMNVMRRNSKANENDS